MYQTLEHGRSNTQAVERISHCSTKIRIHAGGLYATSSTNGAGLAENELQSFRHTICGESDRFHVVDDAHSIWVRRTDHDDVSPHWPHDEIVTAFARKLGNLILVRGSYSRARRIVRYDSAELLSGARTTQIIRVIVNGLVCIDFDAYIRGGEKRKY